MLVRPMRGLLTGMVFFVGGTALPSYTSNNVFESKLQRSRLRRDREPMRMRVRSVQVEEEPSLFPIFMIEDTAGSLPSSPSSGPTAVSPLSTVSPTPVPTRQFTESPETPPTDSPMLATENPSPSPSEARTVMPATESPDISTLEPTGRPSNQPTASPFESPTDSPTGVTEDPTQLPTTIPITITPTEPPMVATNEPTELPISTPTASPSLVCNASPSLRELLIRVVLSSVSSINEIETVGTPQNLAFNWLVNEDTRFLCPDDTFLIQRYSLAVFYYSTSGNNWIECSAPTDFSSQAAIDSANNDCTIEPVEGSGSDAWLTPGSECQWGGVVCNPLDGDGPVETIDFESNGLSGTLASELSQLESLRNLLLEDGVIGGGIPSSIGALSNLEVIDLNFNLLNGPLPEELYTLTRLTQIDLNDNLFSGLISSSISALTELEFFQVQNNQFEGTIPSELEQLLLLGAANFEENNFQGAMPSGVCDLRNTGQLTSLTSDCLQISGRPSPPFVFCDCCTQCF